MKIKRAITFEINRLTEEQLIILGHLNYHGGRNNSFKFLELPETYTKNGGEFVKPPKYQKPNFPHRVITWDKTGFRTVGSKIRLSLLRSLKAHLNGRFNIETGYKKLKGLNVLNVQVVPYKAYGHLSYKLVVVYESVKGLINADVNGARNILRKFKKECVDLLTGLKKVVRIKLYNLKGSSEFLRNAGIAGSVKLPRGIRTELSCQTPRGAPSYRSG